MLIKSYFIVAGGMGNVFPDFNFTNSIDFQIAIFSISEILLFFFSGQGTSFRVS